MSNNTEPTADDFAAAGWDLIDRAEYVRTHGSFDTLHADLLDEVKRLRATLNNPDTILVPKDITNTLGTIHADLASYRETDDVWAIHLRDGIDTARTALLDLLDTIRHTSA